MRREELEEIMNDTDLMDGREITTALDFYRRNKVSNQQRIKRNYVIYTKYGNNAS